MKYPYLPPGKTILYVSEDNVFMQAAKALLHQSGCTKQPTGAVIVKNGQIIGQGT